ncbi:MAG: redoxin domain-containing protein, partial [Euryarchaeota archaeon]
VEEHKEFKEDLGLPFILLSDPERKIAESYGVPVHLGRFPSKSSFVIGPDNEIHFVYDWLFRPRQHVAKILRSLSSVTS